MLLLKLRKRVNYNQTTNKLSEVFLIQTYQASTASLQCVFLLRPKKTPPLLGCWKATEAWLLRTQDGPAFCKQHVQNTHPAESQ